MRSLTRDVARWGVDAVSDDSGVGSLRMDHGWTDGLDRSWLSEMACSKTVRHERTGVRDRISASPLHARCRGDADPW